MKKAHCGGWSRCALNTIAVCFLLAAGFADLARAELQALTNAQMADITGTGFSSFIIEGNRVRADFNILAQTYTEIDSLKMGYWDDGGGVGWDQNWTQVAFGRSDQDMILSGLFIEAVFENLSDSINRRLTGFYFGFTTVSGDLSADFESLSRIGSGGGLDDRRLDLGFQIFRFDNSELRFSFELEGDHRGIWVRFGEGTTLQ